MSEVETIISCQGLRKRFVEGKLDVEIEGKYGSELFGILCSLTSGEANVVVRSVLSKGVGYCGFAALHALNSRFNPKTPARVLHYLGQVISPMPVKDVRMLPKALEEHNT